jgi:hypothetical protein
MDTFKERQQLEDQYTRGDAPWEVWKVAKNGRLAVPRKQPEAGKNPMALVRNA